MTHYSFRAFPSAHDSPLDTTVTPSAEWGLADRTLLHHQRQCLAAEASQWLRQGLAHLRQGQYTPALAILQQALQSYRSLADREREGKVLLILANLYYRVADYLWAADYGRQCLRVAQAIEHPGLSQRAFEHLGNSYRHLGDLPKALDCMGQSLRLAKQMGDRHGEMRSLNNLAMVYRAKGLARQAATLYEAALMLAETLDDQIVHLQILQNLGNTYQALQDYGNVITYFDAFLTLSGDGHQGAVDNYTTRRVMKQLTAASLLLHDYPRAIKYLKRHLLLAQSFGDTVAQAAIMADLKDAYRAALHDQQSKTLHLE